MTTVTVSPTRASSTDLIEATKYPTSPGLRALSTTGMRSGTMTPTSVTSCVLPVARNLTLSPLAMPVPSTTLKYVTTPWYASNFESKMRHRVGFSWSSLGGGTRSTIASSTSVIPSPLFAEARIASVQSRPIVDSISSATRSGSAAGRSILLRTGMISRSFSSAR